MQDRSNDRSDAGMIVRPSWVLKAEAKIAAKAQKKKKSFDSKGNRIIVDTSKTSERAKEIAALEKAIEGLKAGKTKTVRDGSTVRVRKPREKVELLTPENRKAKIDAEIQRLTNQIQRLST